MENTSTTTITQEREPNNFVLQGKDKQISFSTTSFTGRPLFNYKDESRSLSFSGDEIDILEAKFGKLVTVLLEQVPDSHVVYLTLLVPVIILPKEKLEFPIETIAIFTTHRTPFVPPGGQDDGLQVDTYDTVVLEGTASLVFF